MPCGFGRTNGAFENVSDVRNRTLSRRTLDPNNFKFCPKERQVSALVLKDSEHRCIVFTLVALGRDTPLKFLSPFLLPVQGSNWRTHSGLNSFECVCPPPDIFFQFDIPEEQHNKISDNTLSSNSSPSQSSESILLGGSRRKNKRSKSIKSPSHSPPLSCASHNSSVSVIDDLNVANSSFLTPEIPKVDKTVKKSSKRKNKKKGKCKRPRKKIPTATENQCEEGMAHSSVKDNCISTGLDCPTDHVSEMDVSEPVDSLSQRVIVECTSNQSSVDVVSLCSSSESFVVQSQEVAGLSYDGRTAVDPLLEDCNSCITDSRDLVDQYSNSVQEYVLDDWNTDHSGLCSDGIETPKYVKDGISFSYSKNRMESDISRPPFSKECFDSSDFYNEVSVSHCLSTSSMLNEVMEDHNNGESIHLIGQASSTNDFLPVVYKRRGRLARKLINVDPGFLNSGNLKGGADFSVNSYGTANNIGRNAKDTNHSVWKKVQKKDNHPLNTSLPDRSFNDSLKDSDTRGRLDTIMCTKANNNESSCKWHRPVELMQMDSHAPLSDDLDIENISTGDGKAMNDNRGKFSSVSKKTNNISRKMSHSDKMNIGKPSYIQIQKKGVDNSQPLNDYTKVDPASSYSITSGKTTTITVSKCGFDPAENCQETKKNLESRSLGLDLIGVTSSQDQDRSLTLLNSLVQTGSNEHVYNSDGKANTNMHAAVCDYFDTRNNESIKQEIESTHAEHSSLSNSFGYVTQKWVPVERKDLPGFGTEEAVPDSKNLQSVVAGDLSYPSSSYLIDGISECSSPSSEVTNCSFPKDDEIAISFKPPSHSEESDCLCTCASTLEVKDMCTFGDNDSLYVIIRAVFDCYKYQAASESVRLVTGSPIAEFERLLHSASPVLGEAGCIKGRENCLHDLMLGHALYQHEVPNFSLHNIWHWYEQPGCYGLQVKVDDVNCSKSSRFDHSRYDAYFVPYLSAVQLFGQNNPINFLISKEEQAEEIIGRSDNILSAELGTLPNFAELLPQPSNPVGDLCGSTATSEQILPTGKCLDDAHLLFEYFESEQPQRRRPLYEKIKELSTGDTSSASKMFGDPLNLVSLKLHELHPASWYSVAWYPIYRIPDGNFRAAFLTYHSLGHFSHQKITWSSSNKTCIVSPVVGLQSYNAKGECWFQPRSFQSQVVQTEHNGNPSPDHILKERLRTLEHAASTMARASIKIGGQMSVNRQSDFEFFLSRKRGGF